jgi:hypothetical protein
MHVRAKKKMATPELKDAALKFYTLFAQWKKKTHSMEVVFLRPPLCFTSEITQQLGIWEPTLRTSRIVKVSVPSHNT